MSSDSQGLPEGNEEKGLEDEKMKLLTKLLSDEISKMISSKIMEIPGEIPGSTEATCKTFKCGSFAPK
jgi:hypothetical protein